MPIIPHLIDFESLIPERTVERASFKAYPRFPQISLPKTEVNNVLNFFASQMQGPRGEKESVSLREIGLMFRFLYGDKTSGIPLSKPPYSFETYPLVLRRCEGLAPGLFHYRVAKHTLEKLWEKEFSARDLSFYFCTEEFYKSTIIFIFTAWSDQYEYSKSEEDLHSIFTEAGRISQRVSFVANTLGLSATTDIGMREKQIERLLDIDGIIEFVVHASAI